jgi:hypothetical protein
MRSFKSKLIIHSFGFDSSSLTCEVVYIWIACSLFWIWFFWIRFIISFALSVRLFRFEPFIHSYTFDPSSLSMWDCLDLNRLFIFLDSVPHTSMRLFRSELLIDSFGFNSTSASMRLFRFYRGNLPWVPWAVRYGPNSCIRSVPSSGICLGNHTSRTRKEPHHSRLKRWLTNLKKTNLGNDLRHQVSTLRLL